MAIEFHCDHCGKLVRTGAENAGKRGRCPSCHQSVYIPTPSDQLEPLELAPLNGSSEEQRRRLLDETRDLTQRLLKDSQSPTSAGPGRQPDAVGNLLPPRMDLQSLVIEYVQCMADGKLADAEELAAELRRNLPAAERVIERMVLDEIPHPQLANIPRPVLIGFLKQLRQQR